MDVKVLFDSSYLSCKNTKDIGGTVADIDLGITVANSGDVCHAATNLRRNNHNPYN